MALIPLLLLRIGGDAIAPLFRSRMPRQRLIGLAVAFSCTFLVVMALVTPSLSQLQQLQPTVTQVVAGNAITIIWVTFTAAVTEEVMFRGVLQTRLESVLSSAAACVVVGAVVFAVAHVLWMRTRSLALLIVVHAAIDILPNVPESSSSGSKSIRRR